MVQHIRASVTQMRGLISGLLAHSMARDQSLECEQVSLHNQVKHIVATYDHPRGGGEIVAGDLVDVWADRVLVRQVLDNLIGNALKYVEARHRPSRRDRGRAPATTDGRSSGSGTTGSACRPPQRERIFESFQRAAEDYRGTGLGLAICQRIIERHGGSIRVTDNPDGVGSCFEFTLPTTPEAFERGKAGAPSWDAAGADQKRAGSRYSPHS